MRPRADSIASTTVDDYYRPRHFPSLFAAARRERRNALIGRLVLGVYAFAVAASAMMVVVGP